MKKRTDSLKTVAAAITLKLFVDNKSATVEEVIAYLDAAGCTVLPPEHEVSLAMRQYPPTAFSRDPEHWKLLPRWRRILGIPKRLIEVLRNPFDKRMLELPVASFWSPQQVTTMRYKVACDEIIRLRCHINGAAMTDPNLRKWATEIIQDSMTRMEKANALSSNHP